jgi:tetratricopeptide (TPR) repeat protein
MNRRAVLCVILALLTAPAWAAAAPAKSTAPGAASKAPATDTSSTKPAGGGTGGGVVITPSGPSPATPTNAAGSAGAQQVAEIQAHYAAGLYDKAIDAANAFLKTARDEGAKTEVLKVLADSIRKKGDWRNATAAYQRLRERYEKKSDDWVRHDGIYEICRASPNGLYQPPGSPPLKPPEGSAAPATLADDVALAQALTQLATFRSTRLKVVLPTIRRAATPQAVTAIYLPASEEARLLLVLSPDAPPEPGRELASVTGARLKDSGAQIIGALQAKLEKYKPKMDRPWSFTNVEKKDIQDTSAACKQMAESEKSFQASLLLVAGKGDWNEADGLRKDSVARQAQYTQLAAQYVVPQYSTIHLW